VTVISQDKMNHVSSSNMTQRLSYNWFQT